MLARPGAIIIRFKSKDPIETLDFKELETFNLRLLTKMVGWVTSELKALYMKIIKGLYFQYGVFIDEKKSREHHGVDRVCLQIEM